jgi:hypothetical protein
VLDGLATLAYSRHSVKDFQRSAMNCEDARPWLLSRRSGQIALTEWALVEVHLRHCARCRAEDARLQQQRADAHPVTSSRAALDSIRKTMEVSRSGLTGSTAARGRSLLTAVATEAAPRVIGSLVQAASLSIGYWAGLMPRLRAVPAIALGFLARATAWPFIGYGSRNRRPAPKREPAGLQPAPPDQPRSFVHPSPRARIAQVPGRTPLPPAPVFAPAAGHVVGRLSVKDRSAAERELSALLGEVEGTEGGRMHRPRLTAVQVIVPHGRYREFTHGLTRIGVWRLEATGFSLPDAVHVTICVSE